MARRLAGIGISLIVLLVAFGCSQQNLDNSTTTTATTTTTTTTIAKTVPHAGVWGIYSLDLATEDVTLIWSSSEAISALCLNNAGDRFAFYQKVGGTTEVHEEILTVKTDGTGLTRLTNNNDWDLYPTFSPNDSKLAFLSQRGSSTLDLYTMNADGSGQVLLYDSGSHDADVNWGSGGRIAFTADNKIWTLKDDGTDPQQLTSPANAGQWGIANLPIGDYDPRFSPDGSKVVYERMVDVSSSAHGSYDLFVVNSSGTGETRLTTTGYAQGLANWSHAGDKLVYIVSAIGPDGKYDIYLMSADGTNNRNITPSFFPANFLCHSAMFFKNDLRVYFVGQWY